MNGLLNSVIIGFLGLMTLRDIIATSGIIPRDKRFSFLIYNNYDNYIIKETLSSVGIEKRDIANTIYDKKIQYRGYIGIRNLIQIISNFLVRLNGNANYGVSTVISTKYYISTNEASYYEEYLQWMCHLLGDLIVDELKKNKMLNKPDFIITPKGGNTNLGREYAKRTNAFFITSKYASLKSSYVSLESGEPEFQLKTNYEGAWELLKSARSMERGKRLFGVVVDCNTATGEQIIETMNSFNALVKDLNLPIEPVKYAFVLYRAVDSVKCDVDLKFKPFGYKLIRYFDLSETNKEMIYQLRGKKKFLDVHKNKDVEIIDSIINKIKLIRNT